MHRLDSPFSGQFSGGVFTGPQLFLNPRPGQATEAESSFGQVLLDITLTARPGTLSGPTLRGAVNYNDAKYLRFPNSQCYTGQSLAAGCNLIGTVTGTRPVTGAEKGNLQDLSGHRLTRAPQWTGNVGMVILSPQMYGGDRLESLIIPLMTSGINVMTFCPRGRWDNQHVYSLSSAADDVLAAAAYIRSSVDGAIRTPRSNPWRVDPTRIAALGLSGGGGNVGLMACAEDSGIAAAIAIAPNSMIGTDTPEFRKTQAASMALVKANTAGRIDMDKILAAVTPEQFDRMNPLARAERLADKKVLLVGALRDVVSPIESNHKVIAKAIRDAGASGFTEVILETDHAFLTKRIALARLLIGWLKQQCGF